MFCSILICVFCSCNKNLDNFINENISDIRYYIFDGATENYFTTVTFGKRENPYFADGKSNQMKEFGIVEVMFYKTKTEEELSFELKIDNEILNIILEKNPITSSYMTDIEKIYSENSNISIIFEDVECNLTNQSKNWQINYNDALNVAKNTYKDYILSNKGKNIEFYLKIIGKANSYENKFFYWCFMIKGENISKSCAIDVNSGEVLTKT